MKKVLVCASTETHIRRFHLPYLAAFQERGWEVWTASDSDEVLPFADFAVELPLRKRFFSPRNLRTVLRARALLRREVFSLVVVHTTLAAAVVRAAALLLPRKKRPPIVLVCHGYLFREDEGLRKWAYLLPEKLCARVTTLTLTMNAEDFELARVHRLFGGGLCAIAGMGLERRRFSPSVFEERVALRQKLGMAGSEVIFLCAAEFSKRKNQALLLRAFARVAQRMPDARLIFAGGGELFAQCTALAVTLGLEKRARFLGNVNDMERWCALSDVVVSVSRGEGLPFQLMEGLACGLPIIASNVKGNRELVDDGVTGLLFDAGAEEQLAEELVLLYGSRTLRERYGRLGLEKSAALGLESVLPHIMKLYLDAAK